jgi:hypothetical protein
MRGGNLGRGATGAIGSLTGDAGTGIAGLCYLSRATKEIRMAARPSIVPAIVPTVLATTMLLVQAWRLSPSIGCLFLAVPAAYTISPPPLLTVVTPPRPSLEQQASLTPSV